jgi:hypothetical protein
MIATSLLAKIWVYDLIVTVDAAARDLLCLPWTIAGSAAVQRLFAAGVIDLRGILWFGLHHNRTANVAPDGAYSQVLFVDQGKIVEDRPCQEFFTDPRSERARAFLSKVVKH